ncbi:MAG: hypothetical protein DDT37_01869 [Firmicutes bacterium]|nr:hypothetical protein [candidate division NPL-UPA2 bacterium]
MVSPTLSFNVDHSPATVRLCASISPANLPPSAVSEINARSRWAKFTWPLATSSRTPDSAIPNCFASSPIIGIPRLVSRFMSSPNKRPCTRALPKVSAISPIGAPMPAAISPIRRRLGIVSSALIPKAISFRAASANPGNSKGVSAANFCRSRIILSAAAALPSNVVNATCVCSRRAANITAPTPAAIAAAPTAASDAAKAVDAAPTFSNLSPILAAARSVLFSARSSEDASPMIFSVSVLVLTLLSPPSFRRRPFMSGLFLFRLGHVKRCPLRELRHTHTALKLRHRHA